MYKSAINKALQKLGTEELESVAEPNLLNKLESLFTPPMPSEAKTPETAQKAIQREKNYLKRRYNVTPHLTGSMATGLNIPGDVDIDFFVRLKSKEKFQNLVRRMKMNPRYHDSPYNKDNAQIHVFRRDAQDDDDYPVDVAIAYGGPAKDYLDNLNTHKEIASSIPSELKNKILNQKHTLKHTPFDFNNKQRYRNWKRDLENALGGAIRIQRDPITKEARVVDLKDPEELDKFKRYTKYVDMYGHRTPHLDSILQNGKIMSALDALKRGKLKSYEAGSSVGTHKEYEQQPLSEEQLNQIKSRMFTDKPDDSVFKELASQTGREPDQLKAEFLRTNFNDVRGFLQQQDDPESMREKHFSVPKLSPNIFATQGGVLDEPSYGESALLFRNRKAKPSPYANLLTDEHVIPSKDLLQPRQVSADRGYALVPGDKIDQYESMRPEMSFVSMDDIPEDIKEDILKPTRSFSEIPKRWLPSALKGDLRFKQTR